MDATSGISAQVAQTRYNVGISAIKQNAQADQKMADVLQSASQNIPTSSTRGTNVDVKI